MNKKVFLVLFTVFLSIHFTNVFAESHAKTTKKVLDAAPTIQASNLHINVIDINYGYYEVTWNHGNGSGYILLITETTGGYVLPENGVYYSHSNCMYPGTNPQPVGTSQWYCIANTLGSPGQIGIYVRKEGSFRIMVMEYNGSGAGIAYNTSVSSQNLIQFEHFLPITAQASNVTFSNISPNQTNISWTNGNGSSRLVFMKQGTEGTPAPVDGTAYTANSVFGTPASQIGSSGWYCVYNGTGTSTVVSGLSVDALYRVMVVESKGNSNPFYITSTTVNNPLNVEILPKINFCWTNNNTVSGFTINWSIPSGFAITYNIDVSSKPDFSVLTQQATAISGTSYIVNGLEPNTNYYYRIQPVIGSKKYDWCCGYSENFDLVSSPQLPLGWYSVPIGANPNLTQPQWRTNAGTIAGFYYPSNAHSGSNLIYFNSNNVLSGLSATLSSTEFFLHQGQTHEVRFWIFQDNQLAMYDDYAEVYVSTTQEYTNGTLLGTVHRNNSSTGWFQYSFTIPSSFDNKVCYLIFKGVSAFGSSIYLDDVEITNSNGLHTGTKPTAPVATNVSNIIAGSADFTVNWIAPTKAGNISYTYTVEISNDPTFASILKTYSNIPSTSLNQVVTQLSYQNIFYYRVKCVSLYGSSDYSNISTIYLPPSLQAKDIVFSAITKNSITINWTNGNGQSRAVFMKAANSGSPLLSDNSSYLANSVFGNATSQVGTTGWYCIYNGTGNSINVTNLTANTDYRVMVVEYNFSSGNQKYLNLTASTNPVTVKTYFDFSAIGIHVANKQITNTTTDIQYSFNSTNGTDGNWIKCSQGNTMVDFGAGGYHVWVRQASAPLNYLDIATIASQTSAPAYTIDYFNETTAQIIPANVEYSYDNFVTAGLSGNGSVVALSVPEAGNNNVTLYFRVKATATTVCSAVQALSIPARVSPIVFTINYMSEIVNEPVNNLYEYSYDNFSTAGITGSNNNLSLNVPENGKPAGHIYFRYKATNYCFKSAVQDLVIPARNAGPNYTINFINETTSQVVSANDEYSLNNFTTSGTTGTNTVVKLTVPSNGSSNNHIYFRKKATASSFKSSIQDLTIPARQAAPSYTINYANETTLQNVLSTDEYSANRFATAGTTGNGTPVSLTIPAFGNANNHLYLRKKATFSAFSSDIQDLVIIPRVANPSFTIDFANETTTEAIPAKVEYSTNSSMNGAANGTGIKVSLTPGTTLYFRTKATTSTFKSAVATLAVASRPSAPAFTINYINETTNQIIYANTEFSVNSNMNGATIGSGSVVTVTPGTNLYFRNKATSTNFKSEIQILAVKNRNAAPSVSVSNHNSIYARLLNVNTFMQYKYDNTGWNNVTNDVVNGITKFNLMGSHTILVRFNATATDFCSNPTSDLDNSDYLYPTIQAISVLLTNVQSNQLTANWTRGSGNSCIVFMKETGSTTETALPIENQVYTANSEFKKGTQIGTSGWYCVYKGQGTSVTITGLTAEKTYRIMVVECNSFNSQTGYLTTASTNNPVNQKTCTLPGVPGTINGTVSVCAGSNNNIYTVGNISNTNSYIWEYSGSGATITGTSNSVHIAFAGNATSGALTVKGINTCGVGERSNEFALLIKPLPADAGVINGLNSVCSETNGVSYQIQTIPNVTSYNWSYSGNGAVINGTSSNVLVSFNKNATSGNLLVKGMNSCGEGNATTFVIDVKNRPEKPVLEFESSAKNKSKLCAGDEIRCTNINNGVLFKWYKNHVVIDGQTNNKIVINEAQHDIYQLKVISSANQCENISDDITAEIYEPIKPVIVEKNDRNTISILMVNNQNNSFETYQWYYADGSVLPSSMVSNKQFLFLKNNERNFDYMVLAIDNNGCKNSEKYFHRAIKTASLKIYPTVNNGNFSVAMENNQLGKGLIRIVNYSGIVLFSQSFEKTSDATTIPVRVNGLPAGSYYVDIILNGTKSSEKMIIQ